MGDYRVADISLADFGRKEIALAEHEMPGLMACRKEFGSDYFKGARISGSLHMTIQVSSNDISIIQLLFIYFFII